jgi:hypothetical protein
VQVDNLWYNLDFENQTAEVTNSGRTGEYSGSIVIPGSISAYGETFVVTAIGEAAFSDCSGLTSLTIPNSVIKIEAYAFSGCSGLTNIAIPNSVTSLERSTFAYCTALDSIYIPSSVSEIGIWVFAHCDALEKIIVDPNNSKYDSRENCNGIVESETNALIIGCKTTTIPSDVTSIADCAFDDCTSLTSVTIPDSVTSIGDYAFNNCTSLTSVTIPDSVTSIGEWAFDDCTSLTSVTFANPNGWWYANSADATSGTNISAEYLADPATAAEYLKLYYLSDYWFRTE